MMRAATGATQHLIVYTDIEAPKRVPFYNFDGDPTTSRLYANTDMDALTAPATTATTIPPLPIGGADQAAMTRATLDPNEFDPPGSAADGNVIQRFPVASGTMVASFKGNYNGAPGTYSCDSGTVDADCVVTIPPTGPYQATTGTWTFTPELNATAWRGDSEFMSFGWWMQEPNSQNGTYTFQYYADGTNYVAAGTPTGTATYTGRAAGKYVVQEADDSGVTDGMSGQFVAAASLTANFSAAPRTTIEGSISDFQGEGMSMSGWEVTLHRKSVAATDGLASPFPAATQPDPTLPRYNGVTATMGDQTAHGDWTGRFFGNKRALNAAGTALENVSGTQPLGVGGTFQADNDSVSIAGAFGARR